jgi:hypothetical protein
MVGFSAMRPVLRCVSNHSGCREKYMPHADPETVANKQNHRSGKLNSHTNYSLGPLTWDGVHPFQAVAVPM